ncbi:von Willebrand factor C and EGF domain-containing protein isoform X1 [Phthorimaea operculella]|nr:von Willebrand factor C and EGF domain-containing protein isoform X1 [Phthorimaea operculella]
MYRSNGEMASPRLLLLLVALGLLATSTAGPLGPLPNVTSADLGLKEGGCAVGDVVYLPGDEFPGANTCERCRCAGGAVSCARTRCEPRPGCKALHRPDHCCPTYQCECEQEGRVYGNGEKLVDPADPCRVCYCQGGEVVCRRIACFLRDDCTPRLVPGRCCPEYDNCPLRGVTTVPGATPSVSTTEFIASSPAPTPPKENIKQEITIKEITPVSEIPIIPEIKIKEILPSPGFEVPNYSSSKSPLIVREATTERIDASDADSRTEKPAIIEIHPSSSSAQPAVSSEEATALSENSLDSKTTNDATPSKISLSTQDSISNDMYPSIATSFATMGSPIITPDVQPVPATTKAPVIEEEESPMFEHNPAFPPLPDDLSVLSNHEDELMPEQIDNEHVLVHEMTIEPVATHVDTDAKTSTFATATSSISEDSTVIASKAVPETTPEIVFVATETPLILSTDYDINRDKTSPASNLSTADDITTTKFETTFSTDMTKIKDSPMLNLRSAIPTEILNVPSSVPEEITGEFDDATDSSVASSEIVSTVSFVPTQDAAKEIEKSTETPKEQNEKVTPKEKKEEVKATSTAAPQLTTQDELTTNKQPETTEMSNSQTQPEHTLSPASKSNIVTEITAQTEFSSLPIEKSDQKPKSSFENLDKEILLESTANPSPIDLTTRKISTPTEPELITVSRSVPSNTDGQSSENIETTEFVIFGSSETATDAVELIKISAEPEKSAAIIEPNKGKKNSVLTDLINLVGDVAAIGDHTEAPEPARRVPAAPAVPTTSAVNAATTGISESEELIPVNAGYKSKNSNWNLNSITEMPIKSKGSPSVTKQKVVEIEDDEAETITDSAPPNDKVEPTTRRPIIDNVSDDGRSDNRTEKKDIEIITKSYVPTFNRRPMKNIMKKNNELPVTEGSSSETEATTAQPAATSNTDAVTAATTSSANAASEVTAKVSETAATAARRGALRVGRLPRPPTGAGGAEACGRGAAGGRGEGATCCGFLLRKTSSFPEQ